MRPLRLAAGGLLLTTLAVALPVDTLEPIQSIPPEIAGRFRDPRGFQQSASGEYFVFDRRAHAVWGVDSRLEGAFSIVDIGAEPGRLLDPTAFDVAPDGSFVVADAPRGQARIQAFTSTGARTAGFFLPQAARPRLTMDNAVLSGIGTLQFTGTSILVSQPENGSLVSEYALSGQPVRSLGLLRPTGHEADADVHVALNSGIPLLAPDGSLYFVFQAGLPVFRKYSRDGQLLFERMMQGQEVDPVVRALPASWPRNPFDGELPLVRPTVRAAALSPDGQLWVAFDAGFVYVFDADGDKVRTLRLRGAGAVVPSTMSFGPSGRLLVTPGLHEYDVLPHGAP